MSFKPETIKVACYNILADGWLGALGQINRACHWENIDSGGLDSRICSLRTMQTLVLE